MPSPFTTRAEPTNKEVNAIYRKYKAEVESPYTRALRGKLAIRFALTRHATASLLKAVENYLLYIGLHSIPRDKRYGCQNFFKEEVFLNYLNAPQQELPLDTEVTDIIEKRKRRLGSFVHADELPEEVGEQSYLDLDVK